MKNLDGNWTGNHRPRAGGVLTGFLITATAVSFSSNLPGNVKLCLGASEAVAVETDAGLFARLPAMAEAEEVEEAEEADSGAA